MGKKNKKFKKSKSPNNIQSTERQAISADKNMPTIEPLSSTPPSMVINNSKEVEKEIVGLDEKYRFVRKDVNKLFVVIGVIALLFAGVYFLGIKTTILASVGDWIYRIGNFQIQ